MVIFDVPKEVKKRTFITFNFFIKAPLCFELSSQKQLGNQVLAFEWLLLTAGLS